MFSGLRRSDVPSLAWLFNFDIFMHLRSTVDSTVANTEPWISSNIIIGSDEEKGLSKAMHDVFHYAIHLLCVKHLNDNIVTDYMWNQCGVQ